MRSRLQNRRLLLTAVFLVTLLIGLLGRVFYLQIVQAGELQQAGSRQHEKVVTVPAQRGAILDRDGAVLAITQEAVSVCADPRKVENPPVVAGLLAPVLEVDETRLTKLLSQDASFVYLARQVDPIVGHRALALGFAGIFLIPEQKRVYPEGPLAPQLLGYVGTDLDNGLEGIELQYNSFLNGKPGSQRVLVDAGSRVLEVLSERPAEPGHDVVLTIDKHIQYQVERALEEAQATFAAKRAMAVVLDCENGEVLAMACTPVFDTNDFLSRPLAERRNAPVVDLFEPGSTFKLVTVAAALAEGLVTPRTSMTLGPSITVKGVTVREAEEDVPGVRTLTVSEIVARSSNVGAVTLGLKVGKDRLYEMTRSFGFLSPTGIDFPGEAQGLMLPPARWNAGTLANVPIGQGVSVTALQLACAYAAVANNGLWVRPHLTKDPSWPKVSRQVISPQVAEDLRDMLKRTVEEGTGKLAQVPGYTVAGKTGTAEKPLEGGLGYAQGKFMASFVGMIPANKPKLVILVAVDEPEKEHLGGTVAAPVFARIASFAVQHLGILPDDGTTE